MCSETKKLALVFSLLLSVICNLMSSEGFSKRLSSSSGRKKPLFRGSGSSNRFLSPEEINFPGKEPYVMGGERAFLGDWNWIETMFRDMDGLLQRLSSNERIPREELGVLQNNFQRMYESFRNLRTCDPREREPYLMETMKCLLGIKASLKTLTHVPQETVECLQCLRECLQCLREYFQKVEASLSAVVEGNLEEMSKLEEISGAIEELREDVRAIRIYFGVEESPEDPETICQKIFKIAQRAIIIGGIVIVSREIYDRLPYQYQYFINDLVKQGMCSISNGINFIQNFAGRILEIFRWGQEEATVFVAEV